MARNKLERCLSTVPRECRSHKAGVRNPPDISCIQRDVGQEAENHPHKCSLEDCERKLAPVGERTIPNGCSNYSRGDNFIVRWVRNSRIFRRIPHVRPFLVPLDFLPPAGISLNFPSGSLSGLGAGDHAAVMLLSRNLYWISTFSEIPTRAVLIFGSEIPACFVKGC